MKKWGKLLGLALCMLPMLYTPGRAADVLYTVGEMNGIRYMSGGVGIHERERMEETDQGYTLKVIVATMTGHYLADIDLVIEDANKGPLLQTATDGPWLYAELEPGIYKLSATYQGERKCRTVAVGSSQETVMFHWME